MTQLDLVDFQFGTLDAGKREFIENHLCECAACIRSFILLKRNIETGGEINRSPSVMAREKLRLSVEKKFGSPVGARLRNLIFVSVPLYQVAAALFLFVLAAAPRLSPGPAKNSAAPRIDVSAATAVDSSNSVPRSLDYL